MVLVAVAEVVARREREVREAGLEVALADRHELLGIWKGSGWSSTEFTTV